MRFSKPPSRTRKLYTLPQENKVRSKRYKIRLRAFIPILWIVFIVMGFLFFKSPILRIRSIEIMRSHIDINPDAIQETIASQSLEKLFFMIQKESIQSYVLDTHPEIESVDLVIDIPNRLIAHPKLASPYAQVQGALINKETKEQTPYNFFILKNGKVTESSLTSTGVQIILQDPLETTFSNGEIALDYSYIQAIQTIQSFLENEYTIRSYLLSTHAQEIRVQLSHTTLFINLLDPIETQLEKLPLAKDMIEHDQIEYFDLRVPHKVIYKER